MSLKSSLSIKIIDPSDINSLSFELKPNNKSASTNKRSNDYVNNKDLLNEFISFHQKKMEALSLNKPIPPLTNKIGLAIMQIAKRRCYSRHFLNYSADWKEEMIQDAILTAVANCHGFDPAKSSNPFAYLTQIISNAIIQRIKMEHKHNYIKLKMYDNAHGFIGYFDEFINEEDLDLMSDLDDSMYEDRLQKISSYEEKHNLGASRTKKSRMSNPDCVTIDEVINS